MRDSDDSAFFDVPTVRVGTSAGELDAPLKYRDGLAATVFFRVDAREANLLLAESGLAAARAGKERALLAITWFEYRDTSIGRYNELSIALLAAPAPKASHRSLLGLLAGERAIGARVLHLPVTTEIARAGGVELFGYPKTVCDISVHADQGTLSATLADGGRPVLEMNVRLGRGVTLPMPDLLTYSTLDGRLLRTRIVTGCKAVVCSARRVRTWLGDREHPIVRTLHRLGLPQRRPAWTLYSDPFRSLLPLPETLDGRALETPSAA